MAIGISELVILAVIGALLLATVGAIGGVVWWLVGKKKN
jgi:hypothetical protein